MCHGTSSIVIRHSIANIGEGGKPLRATAVSQLFHQIQNDRPAANDGFVKALYSLYQHLGPPLPSRLRVRCDGNT